MIQFYDVYSDSFSLRPTTYTISISFFFRYYESDSIAILKQGKIDGTDLNLRLCSALCYLETRSVPTLLTNDCTMFTFAKCIFTNDRVLRPRCKVNCYQITHVIASDRCINICLNLRIV